LSANAIFLRGVEIQFQLLDWWYAAQLQGPVFVVRRRRQRRLPRQLLTWAFNQPDNRAGGDDCVHMRFLQNTTGLVLADKNCSDKYIVACEVIKITQCSSTITKQMVFLRKGSAQIREVLETGLPEHQQAEKRWK
jgi:hypothetical protein